MAVSGVRSAVYSVTFDGCTDPQKTLAESDGETPKTIFSYSTQSTRRLPLLDIGVRDIGGSNQQFGLLIGPVCFV